MELTKTAYPCTLFFMAAPFLILVARGLQLALQADMVRRRATIVRGIWQGIAVSGHVGYLAFDYLNNLTPAEEEALNR